MGEIITSLKEFVWDIIGYLIPGFLLAIILNFSLMPSVRVENSFVIEWEILNATYIIIVLAYVLGFVVYSLTLFKIQIQNSLIVLLKNKNLTLYKFFKKYHSEYWEESFLTSATFENAKAKLISEGIASANDMTISEMRNIFMSRNPEMDQKVYTFMFRSSLFDHTSTIMVLIVILAILNCFTSHFAMSFMKTETPHIVLYFCFFLLPARLGNAKRIFYSISKRIPFSNLK
jgi:uncharacterized integral membrane protein